MIGPRFRLVPVLLLFRRISMQARKCLEPRLLVIFSIEALF